MLGRFSCKERPKRNSRKLRELELNQSGVLLLDQLELEFEHVSGEGKITQAD